MNRPRIAVVGAGIGGLAAAETLARTAALREGRLELVLLEAAERAGGWLATERCEGALLERGPDTLVTHKPAGLALCERLGLGERIVYPPAGRIDVLHQGRLVPLPAGFALPVPASLRPLLVSSALSWRGRLRVLLAAIPRERRLALGSDDDPSVADFLRARLGSEVYERFCEPVLGGLFMADLEQLSLRATFPSLGGGTRTSASGSAPRAAPAATLEGGLGQIVDALLERLPAGSLRLGATVVRLERDTAGFVLTLGDGEVLRAEAVLIALPAHGAAPLVRDLDAELARELAGIDYASCATVHLAWPRAALGKPPESHGFFVPRNEGSPVVAASFVSVKFPERARANELVIRVFLGGALHSEVNERSDADLVALAVSALAPLLGLKSPPTWNRVWRQPLSMPQRKIGHPARMERIRALVARHPGLEIAGGPVGAYGLPDSIAAGEAAAARLVAWTGASGSQAAPGTLSG